MNVWIRRVSSGVLIVSLVIVLGMMRGTSGAQQEEVAEAGKVSYRHYCAVCHGLDGKGTGEMAKVLKVKPADLTQLSAQRYGIFPFWEVYLIIDGRQEIRGHGLREMPIWGARLKEEAEPDLGAELQAHARILEMVYYLESLQAPASHPPSASPRAPEQGSAREGTKSAP